MPDTAITNRALPGDSKDRRKVGRKEVRIDGRKVGEGGRKEGRKERWIDGRKEGNRGREREREGNTR